MLPLLGAGLISAGGSIAGGLLSAFGASSSASAAQKARDQAYNEALKVINSYAGDTAAFGTKPDPEAFLYHPVDITQSQLDTISGNLKALPSAIELMTKTNTAIWGNDLERIRTMMPGFDQSRSSYIGTTQALQAGRLPFDDVMDILSNNAGIGASMGAPGGNRSATMRDLGMSRLSAMQQGNSMFQNFIQMAEAISPVASQVKPQSMFLTPQERLQADIMQRSLEQQGMASAALAEAMPDPAANAVANANIGLQMARLGGSGVQQPNTLGALGMGLAQGAGAFAQYYGMSHIGSNAAPTFAPGYSAGSNVGGWGGLPISARPPGF